MNSSILIEFEEVTKYPIRAYLEKYSNFIKNHYSNIDRYYSGKNREVPNESFVAYKELSEDSKTLLSQFNNFQNKLDRCGFWELLDWITELKEQLDKIDRMPKYKKTLLSKGGYGNFVDAFGNIGGGITAENISEALSNSGQDVTWDELMSTNDLKEMDWGITEMKPISTFVRENVVNVTSIVDTPVGERIYGRDLCRRVEFVDGDLRVVSGKENVIQKVDILLTVNRGDIPEYPLLGRNPFLLGKSIRSSAFNEIIQDTKRNILQSDLFEDVSLEDVMSNEDGSTSVAIRIKTKYQYSVSRNIEI